MNSFGVEVLIGDLGIKRLETTKTRSHDKSRGGTGEMTTGTLGPGPKYQPILCISFTMVIFSREGEEMGIPHEISLVLGGWRIRHINTSGLGARTWTGRDPGRLSCFFSLALFLLFSSLLSLLPFFFSFSLLLALCPSRLVLPYRRPSASLGLVAFPLRWPSTRLH